MTLDRPRVEMPTNPRDKRDHFSSDGKPILSGCDAQSRPCGGGRDPWPFRWLPREAVEGSTTMVDLPHYKSPEDVETANCVCMTLTAGPCTRCIISVGELLRICDADVWEWSLRVTVSNERHP